MSTAKTRKALGARKNDAADKIWNDHLGNNAFVRHRDQCVICLEVYKTHLPKEPPVWCPASACILDESAAVQHHVQCAACREAYRAWLPKQPPAWCPDGERIFDQMIDEVCEQMDEAITNQN